MLVCDAASKKSLATEQAADSVVKTMATGTLSTSAWAQLRKTFEPSSGVAKTVPLMGHALGLLWQATSLPSQIVRRYRLMEP